MKNEELGMLCEVLKLCYSQEDEDWKTKLVIKEDFRDLLDEIREHVESYGMTPLEIDCESEEL
jgi:hypothetical protein